MSLNKDEIIIQQLRSKIQSLETECAIQENDKKRALDNLLKKFEVKSLEKAIEKADKMLEEIDDINKLKTEILSNIEEELRKYYG